MIQDILKSLGLGEEEIKVYMALLETAPATAGNLSKRLGIARATIYGFLKRLQDSGLVRQSLQEGVKSFSPEPPQKIDRLLKKQLEDIQSSRKEFEKILPEIEKQAGLALLNPRLSFFEGVEGLRHAMSDMLMYHDIKTCAFWPVMDMMEVITPEFFHHHNIERIRNNIYIRAIWPKARAAKGKDYPFLGQGEGFKREIRIAPEGVDFAMGYWTYQNKVIFMSSKRETFGFIIESQDLVETLEAQFDHIWEHSTKTRSGSKEMEDFLKLVHDER